MSYRNNLYDNPQNFGMEIVGEVTWDDDSYQFDFSVVWQDRETGEYYTAHDSGCSCPSPFETVDSRDELEGPFTSYQVIKFLQDSLVDNIGEYAREHRLEVANNDIAVLAERLMS